MLTKLQGPLFCGPSSSMAVTHEDLSVSQNKKMCCSRTFLLFFSLQQLPLESLLAFNCCGI